jgi:MFS transporter, BCD family, chlorophyll transporter
MAMVLLIGTLNRVMIVELACRLAGRADGRAAAGLRAAARADRLPSDTHRSVLGWRRVPYIWFGTLLQFGGLAIMPFALLILLSGDTTGPGLDRPGGAALAFLLVGAGLHTTQTAGLALATDLAPRASRPRVVALLYVMLLVGMVASALASAAAARLQPDALIQVIQGAAVRHAGAELHRAVEAGGARPGAHRPTGRRPVFREPGRASRGRGARRFLVAVGLGTAAFSMQDVCSSPMAARSWASASPKPRPADRDPRRRHARRVRARGARLLTRGADPHRLAASAR